MRGKDKQYIEIDDLRSKVRAAGAETWIERVECADWRTRLAEASSGMVLVALAEKTDTDSAFVFSALIKNSETRHRRVLSHSQWDVGQSIGTPGVIVSGSGEWCFDDGRKEKSDKSGVWFRPIAFSRYFDGQRPPQFDLVQEFELFTHAVWVGDELECFDEAGDRQVVARKFAREGQRGIEVSGHHLRDYLAVKQMTLVRFTELNRRLPIEPSPFPDDERFVVRESSATSSSELIVSGDLGHLGRDRERTWATLYVKELIPGYPQPTPRHFGEDDEEYEEFAIGRDDEGKEILVACEPDSRDFLRPVLFKREVLHRYHQEPSKFRIERRQIWCQGLWYLEYDELDATTLGVYLRDLGHLPRKEQRHWRNHNIPSPGRISRYRFEKDILCEWPTASPADPPHDLREALGEASQAGKAILGEALFRPLGSDDEHVVDGLHVPVVDEPKEFDTQIMALAKMLNDSINVAAIGKHSGLTIDKETIPGSIELLREWLLRIGVDADAADQTVTPLRVIQQLRSKGPAHRRDESCRRALAKAGLDRLPNNARVAAVMTKATEALKALTHLLRTTTTGSST